MNLRDENAMEWWITSQLQPPLPRTFVPVALEAVDRVADNRGRERVTGPGGVTMTADQMVEVFRLGVFLPDPERW